jgi:hypothetical protein
MFFERLGDVIAGNLIYLIKAFKLVFDTIFKLSRKFAIVVVGFRVLESYLQFLSIFDDIFQVLLAFGLRT